VRRAATLLVSTLLAGVVFCTAEYRRYELFEMVCGADLVVAGTIRSVDSAPWWPKSRGPKQTRGFELEVSETISGAPVTGSLNVYCFENWTCASRWAPYRTGQRVLLFLSRPEEGEKKWRILGGGGEGEMPLLQDSICVRGYAVHGYQMLPQAIDEDRAEGSLVPLDQFERAVRGFRETYAWELDKRGWLPISIGPRESMGKAEAFAASSLTARHLHEEVVSSGVWTGDPLEVGVRELPASLPSIDADIEALSAKSPLGEEHEALMFLDALRGSVASRCVFVGDVDGNGTSDLAIALPWASITGRNQGAVWIALLDTRGIPSDFGRILEHQPGLPERMEEYAQFGEGLAGVGDLDGNGVPDLVVGAPAWNETNGHRGGVWVVLMKKDATVAKAVEIGGDPRFKAAGIEAKSGIGTAVALVGDLDRDGYPEIAIGQEPEFEKERSDGRSVFIVSLGKGGEVRWVRRLNHGPDALVKGYSGFGDALVGPGDIDGDGVADLAVSDPQDSDGGEDRGAVWLVGLKADGTMKDAKKISDWGGGFKGLLHNESKFGTSLCAPGDLDGDGVSDLFVGSHEGLWMLFLNRDGVVRSHSLVGNPQPKAKRVSEFPLSIASTRTHGPGSPILLMLGEWTSAEQREIGTFRRALLDPSGELRRP